MIKKCKSILRGSNSNEKIELINFSNNLKYNNPIEVLNEMPKDNWVTNEYQSINIKNNTSTPIVKITSTQVKEDHKIYDVSESSSSCSNKLVTVENPEDDDSQLTDLIAPNVYEISEIKGNLNE
jgi:hypothetical protein